MRMIRVLEEQRQAIKNVDWDQAGLKIGVILRLSYETLKPVVIWTLVFLAIGVYHVFALIFKVLLSKR